MRATAYVRISDDRAGTEAGVTRQEEDARALAAARGWQLVAVHTDNDVSAAGRVRRPGFEAVLAMIDAREVDAVIAWDLTRLTRNLRDRVRLLEAGKSAGTVIALVRGSDMDLSTPAGRLSADILASVAQHEIEQKSDRQRRSVRQAVEQGRWIGGRRPFGYEPDGVTVREPEAAGVRDAYRAALAGESLGSIARALNGQGHTTGQGTPWGQSTVRDLLVNPRYAGLRGHGSVPERGRRRIEVAGPAEWPGLVREETWRAVRGMLLDPSRRNVPRSGTALLTGLARCGICRATIHGGRDSIRGNRTMRCSGTPGHIARKAEPVEEYVTAVVLERLRRADVADLLVDDERPDVEDLRADATALRERLTEAGALFGRGVITGPQLEAASAEIRTALAAVEGQLADAGRVNVLGPLVGVDDVRAVWDTLSTDRRRAVVALLVDVVVHPPGRGTRMFRPETVEITWRTA